jgi:hypothetical protein
MLGRLSPKSHTVSSTDETMVQAQPPDDVRNRSEVQEHEPDNNKSLDLDGMNFLTRLGLSFALELNPSMNLGMNLEPAVASSEDDDAEDMPWGIEPATANWAPMMAEVHNITYSCSHS